jgi:twinkle protein
MLKIDPIPTKKVSSNPVADIIRLDDVREQMVEGFKKGYAKGETTYFPALDEHFTWMKGDVILFAGIGNHGKSAFVNQLALIKTIREGTKWAVFSPEQNPPDYFYNDLIHSLVGKNTEPYYQNQMSMDEYEKAMNFIQGHFFYVYPKEESPTPEYINEAFKYLIETEKVAGCIIDPFNQLENDWEKSRRDDRYIGAFLSNEKRFALTYNVYKVIVAHPKASIDKGEDGNYRCPSVFDLAGGAMWNNKCDEIIFVHRPAYNTDPTNTNVQIKVSKVKKQKLVGIPGEIMLTFDRESNRFLQDGISPFDQELATIMKMWYDEPPF